MTPARQFTIIDNVADTDDGEFPLALVDDSDTVVDLGRSVAALTETAHNAGATEVVEGYSMIAQALREVCL